MTRSTLLAAALSAMVLAACGGPAATRPDASAAAGGTSSASEGVETRAQKRWDLLVAGKAAEAWEYFSPGYRQVKARDDYAAEIAVRPVKWTGAEVEPADCPAEEEVCDVVVNVSFQLESPLAGVGTMKSSSPVLERWIRTDGNWYFVPKEVARN